MLGDPREDQCSSKQAQESPEPKVPLDEPDIEEKADALRKKPALSKKVFVGFWIEMHFEKQRKVL